MTPAIDPGHMALAGTFASINEQFDAIAAAMSSEWIGRIEVTQQHLADAELIDPGLEHCGTLADMWCGVEGHAERRPSFGEFRSAREGALELDQKPESSPATTYLPIPQQGEQA